MKITSGKLHLGCGLITPTGWLNLDGSWNARIARFPWLRKVLYIFRLVPSDKFDIPWQANIFVHDVRHTLPFKDKTFTCIYSSHLLEHLYRNEAEKLLRECFRVLKPGGILRIVVPDLNAIVMEYVNDYSLKGDQKALIADRLNEKLLLRDPYPPSGTIIYRLYTFLNDFHSHKWMYNAASLKAHFSEVGFEDVIEMDYLQSRIGGIDEVERGEQILNGAGVCIEGIRPACNSSNWKA